MEVAIPPKRFGVSHGAAVPGSFALTLLWLGGQNPSPATVEILARI